MTTEAEENIDLPVGKHGETAGRTVHYVPVGAPVVRAAIITDINAAHDTVTLHVLLPGATETRIGVPYSEKYRRSHWSWPQRVKVKP